MPGLNKREMEKGFVSITQAISTDTHKKIKKLCSNRNISLKDLVRKLCDWAGEHCDNPIYLIRSGVDLPLWAADRESAAPLPDSSRPSGN